MKRFFLTLVGVICSLNMFAAVTDSEPIKITIGEAGYATFSAAVNVQLAEGLSLYTAKILGEGRIGLIKWDSDVIPAGVGVIVKGDANYEYEFYETSDEAPADIPENDLKATTKEGGELAEVETKSGAMKYIQEDKWYAIFAKYTGGSYIPNRAYLVIDEFEE